jgi:hypothetical protein
MNFAEEFYTGEWLTPVWGIMEGQNSLESMLA